mgnify:FL=1
MRILYVIGKSQYDSTSVFMTQMADRMAACGWQVTILDGRKEKEYTEQRKAVIKAEYDVIFSINGMLLEEDSVLGKILLQKKDVLYCTYLMDHPLIHYERLKNQYPQIFVLSPDRNHVKFMDQYMKNIYAEAFLPHGGCQSSKCVPYKQRKYNITFMGSYSDPGRNMERIDRYPLQMAEMMKKAVERMTDDPEMTIEEALLQCLDFQKINVKDHEFAQILSEFREVDRYVRSYFRDKVIRVLVENGIVVDVFGDGWDKFVTTHTECLKIHPAVGYEESLELVGDSKISLNIMPWFKDGAHDRIFSAMMCGTVCLTDSSKYLSEQLREQENVYFYSLKGLKYLPLKVHQILQNTDKSVEVAENGKKLAMQEHTWAARSDELMEYLQQVVNGITDPQQEETVDFRKKIIVQQSILIKNIDTTVLHLHRQEYLYAMRMMKLILDDIGKLLSIYEELEESMPDQKVLMEILNNLVEVQETKDYVLLADILQLQLMSFLTQLQENFALDAPKEIKTLDDYRIEPTSAGSYTLAMKGKEHWMYLHSNGNPYREAAEIASAWFDREHYEYVVYGLGLGYHIQALLDIDESITVTVLEPDENVICLAKEYGVIDQDDCNQRVRIISDTDFHYLTMLSDSLRKEQQFVVYYPSMCVMKNEYYKQQLEEYFIGYSSAKTQETRLVGNFVKNQSLFSKEVTELSDRFCGRTVYIIAAGPSLDGNMMELKKVKKEDIILSTGTVLKKLLKAGIMPDYVIVTDGGKYTYPQTAELTEKNIPLLYLSTVYYRILQEYPGDTYLICQEGFQKSEEYAAGRQYPVYGTGGSVTTTALEICIRMRCRRIVFVGLDLAYTNMQNHASGTSDVRNNAKGNMIVKDIYGCDIPTAKNLHLYQKWIERRIQKEDAAGIEFIDATQGGARIEGTEIKDLDKVISP